MIRTLIAMEHEPAAERRELLQQVHKHLGVDAHALRAVLDLRASRDTRGNVKSTYRDYLGTLEKVCDQLDHWMPKKEWQRVESK